MGGWTIDNLCVVAREASVCGDGMITGSEECDDGAGNQDTEANACRTNCRVYSCGDGVVDDNEECDDGNRESGDGCANCAIWHRGGCDTGGNDTGPVVLAVRTE